MKTVKLISIALRNFKGVKLFEGSFPNKESFIRGENATGKTSVLDGICWAIDGKNAAGESDGKFNIKTLDSDNKAIPKLQHTSELALEVNGMRRDFKRVYSEKYTKKHGTEAAKFSGHTTNFFIDGIEHTETLYKKKVAEIIGVSLEEFLMLSSPLYFMNRMKWQDRRAILCDMAGDVKYQDVMLDPKFKELTIELEKYSPEEYKAHCDKTKKDINKQIEGISPRFDELDKMEAEISKTDFAGIEKKISEIELNIKENEEEIKALSDDSAQNSINTYYTKNVNTIKKSISTLESELLDVQSKRNKMIADGSRDIENTIAEKKEVLQNEKSKGSTLRSDLDIVKGRKAKSNDELNQLIGERDKLRSEGKAILAREFSFITEDACPTCKRDYSEEDKHNYKDLALDGFETKNKADLAEISAKGKAKNVVIEKIEGDVKIQANQISSIGKQIELQATVVNDLIKEVSSLEIKLSKVDVDTSAIDKQIEEFNGAIKEFEDKIVSLEEERKEKLSSLNDESVEKIKKETQDSIDCFNADIVELKETLSTRGQLKNITSQKDKLKVEESELSQKWESWEKQSFLVSELIKDYVSRIEESVNKKFSLVNFKLFEIQQNGGIKSICEVLLNGVPDGDINTAGTINAGIDIINTLSEHYGVTVPIVIDNRESITSIIDTKSQVINLIKDESHKVLTQTKQ